LKSCGVTGLRIIVKYEIAAAMKIHTPSQDPNRYNQLKTLFEQQRTLNSAEWEAFKSQAVFKKFPKKAKLLQAGDICKDVIFINKGLIRRYYVKDGDEIADNFFFENAFCTDFGSFISQQPSLLYLETIEPCDLLLISHDGLQHLYKTFPSWNESVRILFEGAFVFMQKRAASFLFDSPETRYLKLLQERPKVIRRVPQYMIASYLGISPETLSRIRTKLAK
jgi:CRP-like cAMP-binding protein